MNRPFPLSSLDQSARSVPADSGIFEAPHLLELQIQHRLENYPSLKFHQLVVHRIPNGVCLEGILDENPNHLDLGEIVRELASVNEVLNQVVFCPSCEH